MSKRTIDEVVIIFNPHSTGDGRSNAQKLKKQLNEANASLKVTLKKTTHAGHAESMAQECMPRRLKPGC